MPKGIYKKSPQHIAKLKKHLVNFEKGEDKRRFGKGLVKELNPAWNGGTSFLPYTLDWTQTLRRSIRERDKYQCKMCGIPQGDRVLDIHHIDYSKDNCSPNNLVSLCRKCHMKTNHNRENWIKFFSRN